ncbi:MAG: hypothetical protein WA874_14330 [Chryseosolibacter sp.]
MEIEELRSIWKKESEGFIQKDETELASMLKGKSSSIVMRLKRNVWLELVFTFLGGLGLLAYALTLPDGALKWTSISILISFAMYSLYYVKKLKLLNQFDPGKDHIKANLKALVESLKGYLKFYRRSYSFLYPIYIFLGLFFTAIEHGATGFLHMISKPDVVITLIVGIGLFFLCSSWLTSWYLKKLFGNHLRKLEALLRELEA